MMTDDRVDEVDHETLVAWIDGELPRAEADRIAAVVASDREWGEHARLLRAARAELEWALGQSETAPPPVASVGPPRRVRWTPWLFAAAAVAAVVAIATDPGGPDASQRHAAENDLLQVELSTPRPAWDLFSGVRFQLTGRALTEVPCQVVASNPDSSSDEEVAKLVVSNHVGPVVPIVVEATLDDGRNQHTGRVSLIDHEFTQKRSEMAIELAKVRTPVDGVAPLLTVRLDENGPREDFRWGFGYGIRPRLGGRAGFVPMEPGNWRLTLRLRALPTEAGADPAFAEPLELSIGFAVGGVVGKWSEPVDGMCARVVAAHPRAGQPLALALQLRNESGRGRRFNVTGKTLARIPQPLHFDLLVDGEPWRQRDLLGVVTTAESTGLVQPDGTTRSMVVLADYWHRDDKRPSSLAGKHTFAIRFHFEPSLWRANDRELWRGSIDTPPISVDL